MQKPSLFRTFGILIFGILILILVGMGIFLAYRFSTFSSKISVEKEITPLESAKQITREAFDKEPTKLNQEDDGRINILLLGRAGESYPGRNLTDTIMLLSIDSRNGQTGLLSLPRDLYAPVPDTNLFTKINSLYQYGINQNTGFDLIERSVEIITGQNIHYVLSVDFDGFEKIIDTVGGITIENDIDILDRKYPGKNYSYETFELSKGWHTLDGKTALKYVRERHGDPRGDFGRAKRQQDVLQAFREKAFSIATLSNIFTINDLFETLGDSIKTTIPPEAFEAFIKLSRSIETNNLSAVVVDAWRKESLLRVSHIMTPSGNAFILVPRTGNWNEVRETAQAIFQRNELLSRKEKILEEQPSILIARDWKKASEGELLRRFLKDDIGFKSVSIKELKNINTTPSLLIDQSNLGFPYSMDELLKKFPLEKSTDKAFLESLTEKERSSDIIIILGKNFRSPRRYETASSENTQNELEKTSQEIIEPLPFSEISN